MPYVHRDDEGRIATVQRLADDACREFVADGDRELLAFVGAGTMPGAFDELDAGFVRVLEDVIDTLLTKNIMNITDLPEQAQAKLFARKSFRERASRSALQLLAPTDFGDVI
ncbi:hypothetical protein [Rhizobacter fulvus]|jgi:hypothetical protein